MIVTNITDEYVNITYSNYTNIIFDCYNLALSNCTDNENSIDMIMPTLALIIPCGLSFL